MGRRQQEAGKRSAGFSGLPLRIAALIAAGSCLLTGSLGLLVSATSADQRLDLNRTIVLGRLDRALTVYGETSSVTGDGVALNAPDLPPELARRIAGGRVATQLADGFEGPQLWAAAGMGEQTLSVRSNYRLERRADQRFNRSITVLAAGTAAAVSLAGLLLAKPLSGRLRRVSRTARRIADGHLDARIGEVRGADEITELAASVDQMAAALQHRLRAEQRFAADVTHELRTPAAGLLAAAEILPESHEADLVRDRVEALCDLIEDLLEVSRLDADVDAAALEPHHLTELLQRVVASTGLPADLRVVDDSTVLTEPRRLERIVANLLANAHRHGAAPVTLTLDHGTLTIQDHGPGYPADLLTQGPRPFRTGTPERGKGSGLGLAIATGHAHLIQARLAFTNPPGGGARATLTLPLDTEAT
ncbi:HAMP domain-containing sensor histidine kinase [Streptomyces sp. NBC_01304]|uniref:HAMP domain-containing sensor histidine kinase n=1 Tax=Streptomyces sp. NBC_01304 TaxID=2903818 RepID=UPI002E117CB4|nr:HAMP domain-containing histidine kinase [Streptomyces sp. NBC_01304]